MAVPAHAYDKQEGEEFHTAYWKCERLAKIKKNPNRFAEAQACVVPLIPRAKRKKTQAELAYRACEWQEKAALDDTKALAATREAFLQVGRTYAPEEMAVRARFRAARLLEDLLGDPAQADVEYRQIVRDSPNAIGALNALVHVEQVLATDEARVQFYERELTARPNTALASVMLLRMGHTALRSPALASRAVKVFDVLARREGAKNDDALFLGAKARLITGDVENAVKALEKLLETQERSPIPFLPNRLQSSRIDDARFLLGEIMRDRYQDARRAEHHFRLLLEEVPDSRLVDDALNAVAQLQVKAGDRQAAAATYAQLIKLRPESRFKKIAAEFK